MKFIQYIVFKNGRKYAPICKFTDSEADYYIVNNTRAKNKVEVILLNMEVWFATEVFKY